MKLNITSSGHQQAGFSLVEIMIALALGAIVVGTIGQAFLTSKVSHQVNQGLANVQDNGRYAVQLLEQQIRMAGYQDRNISAGPLSDALDGASHVSGPQGDSDEIRVAFGVGAASSFVDCAGHQVSPGVTLYVTYSLSQQNDLVCRSHTSNDEESPPVAVVPGVEQLRVTYGEDTDNDGVVNRYIDARKVENMKHVLSVNVCLVANSTDVTDTLTRSYIDCDGRDTTSTDGKLRRSFTTTISLRNRQRTLI